MLSCRYMSFVALTLMDDTLTYHYPLLAPFPLDVSNK